MQSFLINIMLPISQTTLSYISFVFIKIKFIHYHSRMMFAMKSMSIYNILVNYDKIIIQRSLGFKHMFKKFLFKGYLRKALNYLERIRLFNPTHTVHMTDLMIINVEIQYLEK